jgi:hypothetical protein
MMKAYQLRGVLVGLVAGLSLHCQKQDDDDQEQFEETGVTVAQGQDQMAEAAIEVPGPEPAPAEDLPAEDPGERPEDYVVVPGEPAEIRLVPYANCQEIKADQPDAQDGAYTIRLIDAMGVERDVMAYCDMTTDNGGWTLVANYVHMGGTNPPVQLRTEQLPLLAGNELGLDESATEFWGHAAPAMIANLAPAEARFECRTSGHDRIMDFKTDLATCLDYLQTGVGSCLGLDASFTALNNHNATVPAAQDAAVADGGDQYFVDNPFSGPNANWRLATGGGSNDWECDDDADDPNNDTIHRLWIR